MKVKISKKDLLWSYIGYFFSLFTNVMILPFVMKLVPADELGLWYTFLSIGQIVSIFEGTFTGGVSRNITYVWSGVNEIQAEGFKKADNEILTHNYRMLISILETCKKIFAAASISALVFFLSIGTVYISYTARDMSFYLWLIPWIIYVAAIFLNLYYSYWLTALKAVGAMQQAQKATVIGKILQIVISMLGLYFGKGLIALASAYLISNIVLRILGKYYLMHYEGIQKAFKEHLSEINKQEIKDNFKKIWFNAKKNGISCIGAFGITQSTTLICSAYFGLEETASYGLCLQIITALVGVALIYFNTQKPKLTELRISGDEAKGQFIKAISLSVAIYWILYFIELILMLSAGLPVIILIKPNVSIPAGMLAFMGFYLFLENNHALFAGLIEMSNTIPYVPASVISAVIIVIGELLTAKYTHWGIYGLMMVQCIVQLCYNNWKWPSVILKQYGLNPLSILKIGITEGIWIIKRYSHDRKGSYGN